MGTDSERSPLHNFPRYDVTAPYLRMLIGPMDYTPGATMNATRETFRAVNDHPMSQGTRVHQMAMYTLFEAPLQMLADSPSKYMKEQECTDFIAKVPTVFDETVALDGEVGEYLTLARRKGDVWYIASMTDWTPRDCTIDLSFPRRRKLRSRNLFRRHQCRPGSNRLQERSTHRDLGRQAEHTHGTRRRMDSTDMEKMIG